MKQNSNNESNERLYTQSEMENIVRDIIKQINSEKEEVLPGLAIPVEISEAIANASTQQKQKNFERFKKDTKNYNLDEWTVPEKINKSLLPYLKQHSTKTSNVVNSIYKITENTRFQAKVAMEIFEELQLAATANTREAMLIIRTCIQRSKELAVFGLEAARLQGQEAKNYADKALHAANHIEESKTAEESVNTKEVDIGQSFKDLKEKSAKTDEKTPSTEKIPSSESFNGFKKTTKTRDAYIDESFSDFEEESVKIEKSVGTKSICGDESVGDSQEDTLIPKEHSTHIWETEVVSKFVKKEWADDRAIGVYYLQQKAAVLMCLLAEADPRDVGQLAYKDVELELKDHRPISVTIYFGGKANTQAKPTKVMLADDKELCLVSTLFEFTKKSKYIRIDLPEDHTFFLAYIYRPDLVKSVRAETLVLWIKKATARAVLNSISFKSDSNESATTKVTETGALML